MCAEWFTAIGTIVLAGGTLILAVVAIFQDTVRGWVYKPTLDVSIKTQPPDCVAVPFMLQGMGMAIADSYYFRLWVKNNGNVTAKNVEVYASELLRRRADNTWDRVDEFPPMNLRWINDKVYSDNIIAGMGKHCNLGHITDPASRNVLQEENPRLNLTNEQTSLAFDLISIPNHKGHIIGPGDYQLKIMIAAANSRHRIEQIVNISFTGTWITDETRMLSDGVGLSLM